MKVGSLITAALVESKHRDMSRTFWRTLNYEHDVAVAECKRWCDHRSFVVAHVERCKIIGVH